MVVVAEPDLARRLMCRWLARPDMRNPLLSNEEQGKAFESAIMHKDALALHLEVMEQATYVALYPAARWRYRRIPGPTGLPLAGNLLSFTGDGKSLLTYVQAMQANLTLPWWL
ncbi:hypothetical protein HaLaN_24761 [Haematococcus lacustris]|uniref:Uncharacterized protein n=1 Tax=Haematococcus lacustris TaxID=44745 RepID=A0A699ZUM2_HAELA|nr:hypothetical protein HaLaN_24761 [Haematococcus lacustris]